MCMRIYISCFKNNTLTHKQKAKETKEEKRMPVENLTGYDGIICEFSGRTFNLLDRVVSFYWLFISEAASRGVL